MDKKQKKQIQLEISNIIIEKTIDFFAVDIFSESRENKYTLPRFTAMYLIKEFCDTLTLYDIRDIFKKREHATIINALKKAENFINYDADFRDNYQQLFYIVEQEIEIKHKNYYDNQIKLRLLSDINKNLKSMDIILLHNIKTTLEQWKQSNGNQLSQNILN